MATVLDDFLNNLSGRTKVAAFTAQQKAQEEYNKSLFNLEKERIALQNSPEAQKAKTVKMALAFVVFVTVIIVSFIILKKA